MEEFDQVHLEQRMMELDEAYKTTEPPASSIKPESGLTTVKFCILL